MVSNDYSDEALKVIHKTIEKARQIKVHSVILFWVSPFGNLDHRIGYFEDYTEAEMFAKFLHESCVRANGEDVRCSIYIDGSTFSLYVK